MAEQTQQEGEARFEAQQPDLRIPLGTALLVGVGIPVALAVIWLLYHFLWLNTPGEQPYPYRTPPPVTPAPRLLANPQAELKALRIENRQRLHSYGWVDKQRGIVHVPIERAMQLIAEHGFPPRPPVPVNAAGHQAVPLAPTGERPKPYQSGTAEKPQEPPP
ncbi:MAG TPA: hypothetical protein VFL54_09725 [Gammaproteobacteria bacterium]|nr:hypothetical protein [Gammaproteobacteria bacterium]